MSVENTPVRFTVWINYRETIVSAMQGDTIVWEKHSEHIGIADVVFQILLHLHNNRDLGAGRTTAESVLKILGSVKPQTNELRMEVQARNTKTRQPSTVEVSSTEIREYIERWATELEHYLRLLFDPQFSPSGSPSHLPSDLHKWLGKYPIMLKSDCFIIAKLPEFLQEMIGYEVIVDEKE